MVDYSVLDEIIDKEDIAASKDNLFDLFGELYNGETLKIILSEVEGDISEENKVVLPRGYDEYDKLSFNKNEKTFSVILNLFITLIMSLNPQGNERKEIYDLRIALIVVACLNGSITFEKNYNLSDITFDLDYIKNNKKKLNTKNVEDCKRIKNYFPIAFNFLAFSTINYIRFNHHFPSEKVHIIKKVLIKLGNEITQEILEEDNKDTFYKVLVSAARICNEAIFYEKVINQKLSNLHTFKYKYYSILGNVSVDFIDEMIKIRTESTPNGFLILDIIQTMVDTIRNKKLLFLLPNVEIFGELLNIRTLIRSNPLNFHPSRYYFKVNNNEYDKIRKRFLDLMNIVGGIVFYYTENMEESVAQAKCRNKYANKIDLKNKQIIELMNKIDETQAHFKEEEVKLAREKLGKIDFEINEKFDPDELNEKALEILENAIKKQL